MTQDSAVAEKVRQEARDYAAEHWRAIGRVSQKDAEAIRRGEWDDTADMQFFTRMLSAAHTAGRLEGVREALEQAARIADENAATSVPLMRGLGTSANIETGRNRAGTEIAASIRALQEKHNG